MKSVVLDTNVLIDFCKNPRAFARTVLASYDRIVLPAVVLGEFKSGIFDNANGRLSARCLQELLSRPSADSVPVTDATSGLYAKIFQELKRRGRPIPQNDMWIAASALEHGADVATYDGHFRVVPMLTVVTPDAPA